MPTQVTKPTKTWIATIGAVLTVVVPLVTSILVYLPPEWSAVITGVIGALTVLGVYTVPNKPTGDVVVAAGTVADTGVLGAVDDPPAPPAGGYHSPWR